ncbi:MAG: hypothetical protein R2874_02870 [Desulfobacterales bacterium]
MRMAKGYDVIPEELAYKSGDDDFLASARGRSNQAALFLDSTGRAYAAPVSGMPSARSHGTPLTGYFENPPRSRFISVVMGAPSQKLLLASTAGYGFVTALENFNTRNQKTKADRFASRSIPWCRSILQASPTAFMWFPSPVKAACWGFF